MVAFGRPWPDCRCRIHVSRLCANPAVVIPQEDILGSSGRVRRCHAVLTGSLHALNFTLFPIMSAMRSRISRSFATSSVPAPGSSYSAAGAVRSFPRPVAAKLVQRRNMASSIPKIKVLAVGEDLKNVDADARTYRSKIR